MTKTTYTVKRNFVGGRTAEELVAALLQLHQ